MYKSCYIIILLFILFILIYFIYLSLLIPKKSYINNLESFSSSRLQRLHFRDSLEYFENSILCNSGVITKNGKCCPIKDLGSRPIVDSTDNCCYTNVFDSNGVCCDLEKIDKNNNCLSSREYNKKCPFSYSTLNGECCPENTIGLEDQGTRCKINYKK